MKRIWGALIFAALPHLAWANDLDQFVGDNLVSTLYHELGHAIIDIESVPIFGREEDAADVLSVVLIDMLFSPDGSEGIIRSTAQMFAGFAQQGAALEWAMHGTDRQRYFNTVCLYYGMAPEGRSAFANALGLPMDRAVSCPDEAQLALESWLPVLETMRRAPQNLQIDLSQGQSESEAWFNNVISTEVNYMIHDGLWPQGLGVTTAYCDEPNAFYDLERTEIVMCYELADALAEIFDKM